MMNAKINGLFQIEVLTLLSPFYLERLVDTLVNMFVQLLSCFIRMHLTAAAVKQFLLQLEFLTVEYS